MTLTSRSYRVIMLVIGAMVLTAIVMMTVALGTQRIGWHPVPHGIHIADPGGGGGGGPI